MKSLEQVTTEEKINMITALSRVIESTIDNHNSYYQLRNKALSKIETLVDNLFSLPTQEK